MDTIGRTCAGDIVLRIKEGPCRAGVDALPAREHRAGQATRALNLVDRGRHVEARVLAARALLRASFTKG